MGSELAAGCWRTAWEKGKMPPLFGNSRVEVLDIAMPLAFVLVGLLVGGVYFFLMKYSLNHLGERKLRIGHFVGFALLRIALFGGGVVGAYFVGPWCLVTYVVGFVVSRSLAVSRAKAGGAFSPPASESGGHNA
jgi:hypothetical protein